MIVSYATKKDRAAFTVEKEGDKRRGKDVARRIRRRLKEFEAAESLRGISRLPPPRCMF